jgi:glyoxylase-like metal-dependent hydrolase (beta-lactamase superfamily II)
MKRLHRADLYGWSTFDEARDIDFNATLWVRPEGNVLVDPLPMTPHDRAHLAGLGGAAWIVVTNSDHTRVAAELAKELGARVAGPRAEKDVFPIPCDRWLADGEELVPGLVAYELEGSKTPGELVLSLDRTTLIFGDLVRAHRAGSLMLLPPDKLKDGVRARLSVRRVVERHASVESVLVGDGFSAFGNGWHLLHELLGMEAPESTDEGRDTLPSGADDSGQYEIPKNRASIPAPRAGARCSFCDRSASDRRLVSGTSAAAREVAAICAACASGLTTSSAEATCDFCDQIAEEVAQQKGTTICRGCIDLALTIFGDAEP